MPTPKAKTPKPSVRLLSPIVKPAAAPSKPVIAARGTSLAEALFEKARQYHRRHQLPQAIALYRQAIEADPDHFDARFNLTSAYLDNQDYETAYPLAAALARQKPQDPQVLLNLAVAHIGCGRPEEAVRLLDRIAEFPKAPLYEVYFHKGIALRRMNQPARAQEWYEKALHIRGDDPRLLFNMAVARDQLGQYKAAVQAYRDYLENSPAMAAQERRQIEERIRVLQIAMPPTPVKEANPR